MRIGRSDVSGAGILFFAAWAVAVAGGGCGSGQATGIPGPGNPLPPAGLGPDGSAPVSPIATIRGALLQTARTGVMDGKTGVAMDFQTMHIEMTIDNSAKKTTGHADISFISHRDGYPYFLLDASVISAKLNGSNVSIKKVWDPAGLNSVQMVQAPIKAGGANRLEVSYQLNSGTVTYRTGGIGFITAMADISSGNFFEPYGPANFEDDQFSLTLRVNLRGVSSSHRIFGNGAITQLGTHSWEVEYPDYFNSSAFYLHVTDRSLAVRTSSYAGLSKKIPLVVYSTDSASADTAMARLPALFKELEATYGPYLHESFIAYISGSGGMEHSGATITSLSALGHELTHSWFGRGILPGGGASGWLDEAIASWRDYGYTRATGTPLRAATNLGRFSVYERFTPYNSYADGRKLMGEFDYLLASQGGLRPLLKEFFTEKKGQVVATDDFTEFLAKRSGLDLDWMFTRYIFGGYAQAGSMGEQPPQFPQYKESLHPPALTREEIEQLR